MIVFGLTDGVVPSKACAFFGANGTLAFYAINSFIVLFQDSDQLTLDMKKNTTTTASIPSVFFLSFFLFFFDNGVGEHNKERVTPCNGIQDSLGFWIPRPKFPIPGTGFQTVSEIWILDSNL